MDAPTSPLAELLHRLPDLSEEELGQVLLQVRSLLQELSLARSDPDALAERMFSSSFGRDGLPSDPELHDGMLVAGGGKVERSHLSHRCRFVRLGDSWIWERPEVITDVVRHSAGPSRSMRSVTVVPVCEGDKLDLVSCRTQNGVHQLVSVRSFEVSDGRLVLVGSRSVSRTDHR